MSVREHEQIMERHVIMLLENGELNRRHIFPAAYAFQKEAEVTNNSRVTVESPCMVTMVGLLDLI